MAFSYMHDIILLSPFISSLLPDHPLLPPSIQTSRTTLLRNKLRLGEPMEGSRKGKSSYRAPDTAQQALSSIPNFQSLTVMQIMNHFMITKKEIHIDKTRPRVTP